MRACGGRNEPKGVGEREALGASLPWCFLYRESSWDMQETRRGQGDKQHCSLYTIDNLTTGVLSRCCLCHPVVLLSHH